MDPPVSVRIEDHVAKLTDPRRREPTYQLLNIVTMVLCGCDDFVSIAERANMKRGWLAKFLDMSRGVASHDRFNAGLGAIRPDEFEACLLSWIMSLHEITGGQIGAIDGKTLRRSYDKASSKSAIHMVSAWATANSVSLGQVVVDEKSNEITAIQKLLQMLELSGCLVTIDAMGCRPEIAAQIVDQGADYALAVKRNQPTLHDGIQAFFNDHFADDFTRVKVGRHETNERGHGREEHRFCVVCDIPKDLPAAERWKSLKRIGIALSETVRDGRVITDRRSYILSRKLTAKQFAEAVRGHWSIENRLHWELDVTFGEDQCRVRPGHADTNCSLLRRTALSLLKNEKTVRLGGGGGKRLKASWNDDYLEKILFSTML